MKRSLPTVDEADLLFPLPLSASPELARCLVIIVTDNEVSSVRQLVDKVLEQGNEFDVLIIDDNYSLRRIDQILYLLRKNNARIRTIGHSQRKGLAASYVEGFRYAIAHHYPFVIQMNADYSHNPHYLPTLLGLAERYCDVVIGSRHVAGGRFEAASLVDRWASITGNSYARFMLGMSVNDCTSSLKCFRTDVLRSLDLSQFSSNGYVFQAGVNYRCYKNGARILELPIAFARPRVGATKLNFNNVKAAAWEMFKMRASSFPGGQREALTQPTTNARPRPWPWVGRIAPNITLSRPALGQGDENEPDITMLPSLSSRLAPYVMIVMGLVLAMIVLPSFVAKLRHMTPVGLISDIMVGFSLFLTLQSMFTLMWMLSLWNDPEEIDHHSSPKTYEQPRTSFTALVPARHEEKVIRDTILAISAIDYPEHLCETLVLCRNDDAETIASAQRTIESLGKDNIRLVTFGGFPINKPYSLNQGLLASKNEFICVFDAEDEPHPEIYNIINTVLVRENVDVVQAGVQLMNFRSNWFSILNVLEYFFWFKSGLRFFTLLWHVTPLGGNTVFIRRSLLQRIGGWDHNCLTEDADLGIRLTTAGARIHITYDELHATQEETPPTIQSFIKQRTRWNQGFLQVLLKRDWQKLPHLRQQFLACYVLLTPLLQASLVIVAPVSIFVALTIKMPVGWTMITFIPLGMIVLQFLVSVVGLIDFANGYRQKLSPLFPLKLFIVYYPYQLVMAIAAFRAVLRMFKRQTDWEKTRHANAHRLGQIESSQTNEPLVNVSDW